MNLSKFRSPFFLYFFLLVFSVTLVPSLASSQQKAQRKLNIAILDFDTRSAMSKDEAASLSDIFQSYIVDTGEFTVVDRARIKALLQEQGFQESGACSEVQCIVEAGRILKVEKMFAGTIGKVGKIYNVSIQMIDVSSAQIQLNKNRQYDGSIEGIAENVIPEMADEIITQVLGKEVKVARTSSGMSFWWYAGGAALLGGGAAAYLFLRPSQSTVEKKTLPTPPTLPQ